MKQHTICRNAYLSQPVTAYFNTFYTGYNQPNNPDFINVLKNTFNNTLKIKLIEAQKTVENILCKDIPHIMRHHNWNNCVLVSIPRAKAKETYFSDQLLFITAISNTADNIPNVIDGTNAIIRHTNTKTTHLRPDTGRVAKSGSVYENDGLSPYSGITKDTCNIDKKYIQGKNVILIDDIYTKGVNIDEDCLQALLELNPKELLFYSIAYTRREK